MRFTKMIPNMFTLGNLYCGFLSIGFAANGQFNNAAILILIGMMLDSMDGRLARMLKADSQLGKELDSLADIVTFGVAPSFLVYYTYFHNFGILGTLVAGLFPLFGAYRLARFNISTDKSSLNYFIGVPITAAGGIMAILTLFVIWKGTYGQFPYLIYIATPLYIAYLAYRFVKGKHKSNID